MGLAQHAGQRRSRRRRPPQIPLGHRLAPSCDRSGRHRDETRLHFQAAYSRLVVDHLDCYSRSQASGVSASGPTSTSSSPTQAARATGPLRIPRPTPTPTDGFVCADQHVRTTSGASHTKSHLVLTFDRWTSLADPRDRLAIRLLPSGHQLRSASFGIHPSRLGEVITVLGSSQLPADERISSVHRRSDCSSSCRLAADVRCFPGTACDDDRLGGSPFCFLLLGRSPLYTHARAETVFASSHPQSYYPAFLRVPLIPFSRGVPR